MLNVKVLTIPHRHQRYDTLGDYYDTPDGTEQIRVSELSRWQYEVAVGLHEWFEKAWCKQNGIKVADVDAFDDLFEKERAMGIHGPDAEPGDDPRAPYFQGHCIATAIERMVIAGLNQRWGEYELACSLAANTWMKKPKRKGHK